MVIIKREAYLPKERAAVKDTTYLYHVPTHIDTTIYDGKPNLLILLKIFICMKPVGFFGLLTLILITLKLTGVITWSWWFVLLPLIIPSIHITFQALVAATVEPSVQPAAVAAAAPGAY